ncbi:hypothetical protein DB347_01095 [Opitutaceae bacterium EW11]|nr:hypothetical protein DB347_01095 [Opitutaceae bacterium EW11]
MFSGYQKLTHMKITTLLSYASAAALAALIAGLFSAPSAMTAGGVFITLLASLIVVRDYSPRNHFVVTTAGPVLPKPTPMQSAVPFPAPRRQVRRHSVALVS